MEESAIPLWNLNSLIRHLQDSNHAFNRALLVAILSLVISALFIFLLNLQTVHSYMKLLQMQNEPLLMLVIHIKIIKGDKTHWLLLLSSHRRCNIFFSTDHLYSKSLQPPCPFSDHGDEPLHFTSIFRSSLPSVL